MLSYIRNGTHPPSGKVLRRLAQAEREANITVETEPQLNSQSVQENHGAYGPVVIPMRHGGEVVLLPEPLKIEEFVRSHPDQASTLIRDLLRIKGELDGLVLKIPGYTRPKK